MEGEPGAQEDDRRPGTTMYRGTGSNSTLHAGADDAGEGRSAVRRVTGADRQCPSTTDCCCDKSADWPSVIDNAIRGPLL